MERRVSMTNKYIEKINGLRQTKLAQTDEKIRRNGRTMNGDDT